MSGVKLVQDIFKLMGNSTIVDDPELHQSFQAASGMAASVEAMKTRKAARAMTKALRDVNPKLAKALIDDRDKVCHVCFVLGCAYAPAHSWVQAKPLCILVHMQC